MTLTQLEYIIAVDTYRHFGRAAAKCFVTQPTLSMQIQKLEEELGARIFDRSKMPVIPTEVGETVITQAREVIKESNRIKEIIIESQDYVGGTLQLGIIPTIAPYLLPLFIASFIKKYPQITLHVEELQTEHILKRLYDETIDAGILVTPTEERGIFEMPLYYEKFVVYTSKNHPLSRKDFIKSNDLDTSDIWLLTQGHCFRNQMLNLCQKRETQNKISNFDFESGSLETLRKLVEQESGYTLLPELAIREFNKSQQNMVRFFEAPAPAREVSIITRRNHLKQKQTAALKEQIIKNLPESLLQPENKQIISWKK